MRKGQWMILAAAVGMAAFAGGCSQDAGTQAGTEYVQADTQETAPAVETVPAAERGTYTPEGVLETAPGEEADADAPVRIWGVVTGTDEGQIMVDNQSVNGPLGDMLLHIDPENTVLVDAQSGLPVEIGDVELGAFEAYLGPAMTLSLPPQTTPYAVIVNIPEGYKTPVYVVAAGAVIETDYGKLLDARGMQDYILSENVDIQPYLTRNIVTDQDIREGSRCLVWLDEYDNVAKLVLFAAE